jgi:serine/threonine protein kinase
MNDPMNYPLNVNDMFLCGTTSYNIIRTLSTDGQRGLTYVAVEITHDDSEPRQVVIKIPNLDQNKRTSEIKERSKSIIDDVERETNAWKRLTASGDKRVSDCIADVYEVGTCMFEIKGEGMLVPYIIQEYIPGKPLKKWCEENYSDNGSFHGIPSAEKWFALVKSLTRIIALVHRERVIHGDIWPPNIIMKTSLNDLDAEPVLIDFGQAWLVEKELIARSTNDVSYKFYAPEKSRSGNVWYAPADLFSLGGVFYVLATGEDPPNVFSDKRNDIDSYKSNTELKYEIAETIQRVNSSLYNENPGIVDVIQYCLRPQVNERAPHAEAVLELIQIFETAFGYSANELNLLNGGEVANTLQTRLQECDEILEGQSHKPFFRIFHRDVRSLISRAHGLKSRNYDLLGDRESIVNGLLTCLATLKSGDQCLALTTAIFWARQNFGTTGRFLTMLKMAGLKGIAVRWVILLTEKDLIHLDIQKAVRAHQTSLEEIRSAGIDTENKNMDGEGYYIGYDIVDEDKRFEIARQAKTFIVLNRRNLNENRNYRTLLAPAYTRSGMEGNIAILRLWENPQRWSEFQSELENYLPESTSIASLETKK